MSKAELPLRKEEIERECREQRAQISQLMNRQLGDSDFLDLGTTRQLYSFYETNRARSAVNQTWAIRKTWRFEDETGWVGACRRVGQNLGSTQAAFFLGSCHSCGCLRISAKEALIDPVPLLRFDHDSLKLQAPEGDGGLEVEWYEEGFGQEKYYIDIHGWGGWKSVVERSLATTGERIGSVTRRWWARLTQAVRRAGADFYVGGTTTAGPWAALRECRVVRTLKVRGSPQYLLIKLNPPVVGHQYRGQPHNVEFLVITPNDLAGSFERMQYPFQVWAYMIVSQKNPLVDTISHDDLETVPARILYKQAPKSA